jgi:hypothetical protein
MANKTGHQLPRVPAPGGGPRDRSRDDNGQWRKKRSDAGHTRPPKK